MPWPLPLTVLMTPPFRRAWLLHGEPGNEKQSIWMRLLLGLTVFLVLISPFEVQANYYRQFEHGPELRYPSPQSYKPLGWRASYGGVTGGAQDDLPPPPLCWLEPSWRHLMRSGHHLPMIHSGRGFVH